MLTRPASARAGALAVADPEEPQYFGTQVTDTAWADEINFGVEHYRGERFCAYVGIAWSTPDTAVEELFGDHDFTVIQTFPYTF